MIRYDQTPPNPVTAARSRGFRLCLTGALIVALAACDISVTTSHSQAPDPGATTALAPDLAARNFTEVVRAVQPVATQECRQRLPTANCNFLIRVDPNPRALANAYQSVDKTGRPVLTFTGTLIAQAHNPDELAFIMGHEAAHHISGHLVRQQEDAENGAAVFAGLSTLTGGSAADVAEAQELGAAVGARSHSKEFELEADELGTIITYNAGYDPLIGARFFMRIPDPGNRFLGTHPPNASRYETVRRTSAGLGFHPV